MPLAAVATTGAYDVDPAERLLKWDAWLRATLRKTLRWPASQAAAARLAAQRANQVTVMARQLRRRGWLLDGDALARHVCACLEPVAAAQRAGKTGDFRPCFKAPLRRHAGANAEEIQLHARRAGADAGAQPMGAVPAAPGLGSAVKPRGESLTGLITRRADEVSQAKTLRRRQADARRPQKQPRRTPLAGPRHRGCKRHGKGQAARLIHLKPLANRGIPMDFPLKPDGPA
jgi:hypothetical protein